MKTFLAHRLLVLALAAVTAVAGMCPRAAAASGFATHPVHKPACPAHPAPPPQHTSPSCCMASHHQASLLQAAQVSPPLPTFALLAPAPSGDPNSRTEADPHEFISRGSPPGATILRI